MSNMCKMMTLKNKNIKTYNLNQFYDIGNVQYEYLQ